MFAWIESRTGVGQTVRRFFAEEIPASAGWPQVFGSVALFVLIVQAVTGILLALNFAAAPGDAYDSISYLTREVTGGRIIRGLHHWGASAMILVVAAHAMQVFIYGAYKKPREATWLCGIALLLVVMGFSLTGYLLPWDNRAYWGTVVTTQIAGQAPLLGKSIQQLMGAGSGVGVVTFARFYALHVLVLPVCTVVLTGIHLFLVRKHGATPSAANGETKVRFYPGQAAKDMLAIFVVFALLMTVAVCVDAPLDRPADPSDSSYVPRPEWYFLSLFQVLKYLQGGLEPIASVGLPSAVVLILILIPFLDRSVASSLRHRWWAIAACAAALAGCTSMTALALRDTPAKSSSTQHVQDARLLSLPPDELAGFVYFRQSDCASCHNLVTGNPKQGPTLATVQERRPPEWTESHIRSVPQSGSKHLSPAEVAALVQFAVTLDPAGATRLESAPAETLAGADVYTRNLCQSCHRTNGSGGQIGPSLNGVVQRRSRSWVERHFAQPAVMSPKSIMPPYRFAPDEETKLVDYLFALP